MTANTETDVRRRDMTPTIDPTTASETAIRLWLATLPCPDGARCPVSNCKTFGLALPWASLECPWCRGIGQDLPSKRPCNRCGGSGRAPKALGLEELLERFPMSLRSPIEGCCPNHAGWQAGLSPLPSENPTLAVLRVIAAQAMAGMR